MHSNFSNSYYHYCIHNICLLYAIHISWLTKLPPPLQTANADGKALGFNVGWAADKGIFLETDKPYDANN